MAGVWGRSTLVGTGPAFYLEGNTHLARVTRSGQQHHDPIRMPLQVVEAVHGHGRVPHQLGFAKTNEVHVAVAMGTEGTADKIPILTGHIAGDPLQFSPLPSESEANPCCATCRVISRETFRPTMGILMSLA